MRLFWDMDGTLAVWQTGVPLSMVMQRGYFENLPEQTNVVLAAGMLIRSGVSSFVNSAYFSEADFYKEEKEIWIKKRLPLPASHMYFVPCGQSKATAVGTVSKDDFLVDDRTLNLLDWEIAGGTGIKIITEINDTHRTWSGARIYAADAPRKIASDITAIIRKEGYCDGRYSIC